MTHPPSAVGSVLTSDPIPDAWATELRSLVSPEENVRATLEVDLDARLHFAPGLVVVCLLYTSDAADE